MFSDRLLVITQHRDEVQKAKAAGKKAAPNITQLYNAGKYGTCIIVVLLSYADHVQLTTTAPPAGFNTWADAGWVRIEGLLGEFRAFFGRALGTLGHFEAHFEAKYPI